MRAARHLERGTRAITAAVLAAVVVLVVVGAVVVSQLGSGTRRPQVVQLPAPTVASAAPDPTTTAGAALRWTGCGGGFQCATLAVPLDWTRHDPAAAGRTVPLALVRSPATGPAAQRLGSLVVNPGGPGASGVQFVRDDLTTIPPPVRARFDVVGFDPRGTGASAPVRCLPGPRLDALYAEPPAPTTTAQSAALLAGAKELAGACARTTGDELRHLSTVDAARDLEAIRAALGEPRLTYLGYSYGTYLGAAYARLFPTRIRAFVLDGALDPTLTGTQLLAGQAAGFEGAFDGFAAWCAGSSRCAVGSTLSSAAQVEGAYAELAAQVATTPLPGTGGRRLTAGLLLEGTLATLYDRDAGWPLLGTALSLAQRGSGALLLQLADGLLGRRADGTYTPEGEANLAVNCVDHDFPDTAGRASALASRLAVADPLFGRAIAWSALGCSAWPVPSTVDLAPVRAAGAPPILVVGTTRDPATPYAGAVSLASQLETGTLLTHDGDGHTAYRSTGSTCVQRVVDDYLLTLAAPPRATGEHC